ncbi:MAG TPA: DUF5701 family protein [Trueperaceae bacterium]|jgi:hypothetical protein|nr:DUF5701 family protein [Trueperaceae bacterium]
MPTAEFARQVDRLVALGYPGLLDVSPDAFRRSLEPLAAQLDARAAQGGATSDGGTGSDGTVDYVIVIDAPMLSQSDLIPLIERRGLAATENLYPREVKDFSPIESVDLPAGDAYVLLDVDRGAETIDVTPNDAYERIARRGRSGLTIAEGLALLTHYPEFLQPNNCFSMLASRAGDKRVPALWLSDKRPKLGWCWAGNPHTWLGSASCGERIGAGVRF